MERHHVATKEITPTMSLRKNLAAVTAVGALAVAAPMSAGAATPSALPINGANGGQQVCLHGIVDLGPFGPLGPYGPHGPYGPDGPLHGQPNPIGNAAECGGLIAFVLNGGTLQSFVNANIASAGVAAH
jgi:hypothetical protein